jgi:hypothetical protein
MPKPGPELETMPAAAPAKKAKTISEQLTDMQAEMKGIADEESKKPFGGNLRGAINKMKAKAAEEDQKVRDYAENAAKSLPTKGA